MAQSVKDMFVMQKRGCMDLNGELFRCSRECYFGISSHVNDVEIRHSAYFFFPGHHDSTNDDPVRDLNGSQRIDFVFIRFVYVLLMT